MSPTLHAFELSLDDFWSTQDVRYNFLNTIRIYHRNITPIQDTGSDDIINKDLLIQFETAAVST